MHVARVRTLGATLPFDRVMVGLGSIQTGCEGVMGLPSSRGVGSGLAKGDGCLVERKSLALGTGPIDLSVSVAQSNHRGSHTVTMDAG